MPKRFALYGEYAEALRFIVDVSVDGLSGMAGGMEDDVVVVADEVGRALLEETEIAGAETGVLMLVMLCFWLVMIRNYLLAPVLPAAVPRSQGFGGDTPDILQFLHYVCIGSGLVLIVAGVGCYDEVQLGGWRLPKSMTGWPEKHNE